MGVHQAPSGTEWEERHAVNTPPIAHCGDRADVTGNTPT